LLRKIALSLGLAAGIAGGVLFSAGSASAASYVPGGLYPSNRACTDAGQGGISQGRWTDYYCQLLDSHLQYELWVLPR
jgi:hypothetical protein